jgi:hypothetical protein
MLHSFDRFSLGSLGSSLFTPHGNEVIVDAQLWDVRMLKLMRTIPGS